MRGSWTRRVLTVLGLATAMVALTSPAHADAVPYSPTPLNGWDTNGTVYAVKIVGNTVYLGGTFTQVRSPSGATSARVNLAALNATTGAVLAFRADTNGAVRSLEGDGSTVWAGGSFTAIRGVSRGRLAALDPATGAVRTAFSANATGTVYALERGGSSLYVGGAFGSIRGVANARLAAVDPATGAVRTTFKPAPNNTVLSLAMPATGTKLFAGGDFTTIGGVSRAYLSGLNPTSGAASGPTMASVSGRAISVDTTSDGSVLFAGLGGSANRVSSWSASTGARRWLQVAMGDVQAVRYRAGTVYFGFHEGFANNLRLRMLAVDSDTGKLESYRPTMDSFYGVWAIDVSDSALVAGGEFTVVSGVPTRAIAIFRR